VPPPEITFCRPRPQRSRAAQLRLAAGSPWPATRPGPRRARSPVRRVRPL